MKTALKLLIGLVLLASSKAYAMDAAGYENWRSSEVCATFGSNVHMVLATAPVTLYSVAVTSGNQGTFQVHNATSVASITSTSTVYNTNVTGSSWVFGVRFNRGFVWTFNGTACVVGRYEYLNNPPLGRERDGKY